jgi:hypothetical protein
MWLKVREKRGIFLFLLCFVPPDSLPPFPSFSLTFFLSFPPPPCPFSSIPSSSLFLRFPSSPILLLLPFPLPPFPFSSIPSSSLFLLLPFLFLRFPSSPILLFLPFPFLLFLSVSLSLVLSPVRDYILQEFNTLYLTRFRTYTVKKAFRYSRPLPGCHLPNSPWAGGNNDVIYKSSRLGRAW